MIVDKKTGGELSLPNRYVSPEVASEFLDVELSTLANWRSAGFGPKFTKLSAGRSGAVRYSLAELQRFADDPVAYRPRVVSRFRPPQKLARGAQPNVSIARARRKRHGKAKS